MGQTNETEGKIALTKEQFIFYKTLKIIEEAQCQDPVDIEMIKKAKDLLWRRIWKFAKQICFQMMGDFSTEEERNDVLQDMAVIFFERLPDYDPLRTTPTTYYVRYFKQVISDYIRKNKAHRMAFIRWALLQYESPKISYDTFGLRFVLFIRRLLFPHTFCFCRLFWLCRAPSRQ